MDNKIIREALNELFSSLEALETQSAAILQFLKEKKRVSDEQLAPYLEQAGNASNVRWRAARIRIEHLFAAAERQEERAAEKLKAEKEKSAGSTLVEYMGQGSDKTPDGKDAGQRGKVPARESDAAQSKEDNAAAQGDAQGQERSAVKSDPAPNEAQPAVQPAASQPAENAADGGDGSQPKLTQAEPGERKESSRPQAKKSQGEKPVKKGVA